MQAENQIFLINYRMHVAVAAKYCRVLIKQLCIADFSLSLIKKIFKLIIGKLMLAVFNLFMQLLHKNQSSSTKVSTYCQGTMSQLIQVLRQQWNVCHTTVILRLSSNGFLGIKKSHRFIHRRTRQNPIILGHGQLHLLYKYLQQRNVTECHLNV